jgi:hypothetical protein
VQLVQETGAYVKNNLGPRLRPPHLQVKSVDNANGHTGREDQEPTMEGRTRPEPRLMHAHMPTAPTTSATIMGLQEWMGSRRIL